jgi:DNA-binding response OmpR family regulator
MIVASAHVAPHARLEGYDVVAAEDGEEALRHVRDKLPDAVVRLMLPGIGLKSAADARSIRCADHYADRARRSARSYQRAGRGCR